MKSIFKAVATVTIFSIITRALGFLFRIYLSRELQAEGLGLFQLASSILTIFLTIISSGLPLTTAKFVSKYEINNQYNRRNKVVSSALVIAIGLSLLSSLIIVILKNVWGFILTDNRAVEIILILIPSILFSAIYAIFRGGLWGQHDYFNCGLTELLEQVIRFAATFVLLVSVKDMFLKVKLSAWAFDITCLLSAIIVMVIYLKKCKLNFRKGEYKLLIKSALPVTGVKVASSLIQPITSLIIPSMLMISGLSSSEAISSFGVMMGMVFPMLFVPMAVIGSISMVLIPSISSMLAKNEIAKIKINISNSLNIAVFISMIFVPLYLSVGNLIGLVLFNNSMAGTLLQISSICILPISLCNLTSSILDALNLEVKAFKNYLIGSALLITLLIALTPVIGINSIIISFFASMSTITLLNLKTIKNARFKLEFNLIKTCVKYSLIIVPCSVLGNLISNIFLNFFNYFFSGLIGGSVSMIATVVLVFVFNLYNINNLKELLKHKRKTA